MKHKTVNVAIFAALAIGLGVYTQATQEYALYRWEEQYLFAADWLDVRTRLAQPGGVAIVLGSLLTQFMHIKYAGAVIMTLIYGLVGLLLGTTINVLAQGKIEGRQLRDEASAQFESFCLSPLAMLPCVFVMLCAENVFFLFYGHVAFVLMLLGVRLYCSARRWRVLAGIVLSIVLYGAVGATASVFALTALLVDVVRHGFRGLYALTYCALVYAMGQMAVGAGYAVDMSQALLPLMYYDSYSSYFVPLYAWALVPVIAVASWLMGRALPKGKSKKAELALYWVSVALFVVMPLHLQPQAHSESRYVEKMHQRMAAQGEWDKIIASSNRLRPIGFFSYTSLALAERGQLMDQAERWKWHSLKNEVMGEKREVGTQAMMSRVYYECGYVAAAQQAAFEGNLMTAGSTNGQLLQTMVSCSIALGQYEIAQKYIKKLERTTFYAQWAKAKRAFLYDDAAVENDAELGSLRRSLPKGAEGGYIGYRGVGTDLKDIAEANPSQQIASQYLELYTALSQMMYY